MVRRLTVKKDHMDMKLKSLRGAIIAALTALGAGHRLRPWRSASMPLAATTTARQEAITATANSASPKPASTPVARS